MENNLAKRKSWLENDGDWLKLPKERWTVAHNIIRKGLKGITFVTLT